MKRSIIERSEFDSLSMANCIMLLSQTTQYDPIDESISARVFECKTCNRQFPSFQALGGHRASHKKPRLATTTGDESSSGSPAKPKTHECSICGLEFAIGQALGGHMRRHRAAAMSDSKYMTSPPPLSLLPPHPTNNHQVPVVKKSNSRRVLCLDLNLTPVENDLEIRLGKPVTPVINCYL